MNDDIVNACQQLLSRQFSSLRGLQSVNLGRTLAFNIERGEFVQILHTGQGHWVTISTIGCTTGEVNVFDSLPPAPTTDLLNQIAAILCTPKDTIKVKYIDVQMQEGYSDCGVFAVAFATALANGKQPGSCFFKQEIMRDHVMKCLQEQNVTMFPVKKTRRAAQKVKSVTDLHVFCKCRMPEVPGSTMIQCSNCNAWYHIDTCVSVPKRALQSTTKWFCSSCSWFS